METLQQIINTANDVLWTYILIAMLLGCAVYFTWRTRFVQFRNLREMLRLLTEGAPKSTDGQRQVSSFQAFAVSIASRVGTGNLAGVATAIAVGGAGAVFWMWIIALLGSVNAFVESTLAQLYKRKDKDSYIGGPAYYMQYGLGKRWMGALFAVLIAVTFGFAFNSVQSNTICAAWEHAFGIDHTWMGIGLTVTTLAIIFGGIHRIARVSSWLVPIMAVGYIVLALGVVIVNITELPSVIGHIVRSAFGWEQAVGGGMGAAVMQGIKRGLFSNEAGMGSAPNVAATATVTHPAKQGFIQALGVFTDTLVICTCTAFIILVSDPSPDASLNGIQLTQAAFTAQVGQLGSVFVAIAILLFAFSSIIGNYYYGESNIRFISRRPIYLWAYRILVGAMVMCGAVMSLDLAWSLADVTMGLMTVCNLIAIVLLARQALWLLRDYTDKRRRGIDSPTFHREEMPEEMRHDIECWD
ncbi:MAG: alanine:cation symporter family protein [Bacteroidaceae bacterium]|nr:alanine:cation symporter family protein [Bacteroidaceae bacterium]